MIRKTPEVTHVRSELVFLVTMLRVAEGVASVPTCIRRLNKFCLSRFVECRSEVDAVRLFDGVEILCL